MVPIAPLRGARTAGARIAPLLVQGPFLCDRPCKGGGLRVSTRPGSLSKAMPDLFNLRVPPVQIWGLLANHAMPLGLPPVLRVVMVGGLQILQTDNGAITTRFTILASSIFDQSHDTLNLQEVC